jgi:hypothetical protein
MKAEILEIITQHKFDNISSEQAVLELLDLFVVSGSLTPFGDSIKLLRDLADLQNGAPLEQYRQEWEETMEQVYDFLNRWEGQ